MCDDDCFCCSNLLHALKICAVVIVVVALAETQLKLYETYEPLNHKHRCEMVQLNES